MVVSPPHAAVTIPRFFGGEHLGQFHCSTRHSFSKRLFYIDIAHFILFDHMWAYGWGWAKTAGSNLECRMQYSLEIALFLPPLSHICAPQSEFIWFSLLPSPLFPPNREATKTVLLFLYPYPFVHLPQHFYHRVISGEGHFTLCPTMGIKEGKTISHKDIACDDCFGENILLLFPTRITDKFYLKYKIKVFLSFYLCIPYLGNRIISCHDLCFL